MPLFPIRSSRRKAPAIAFVTALLLASRGPSSKGWAEADARSAEKYGRIVDARTNAGIPGVTLVVSWHSTHFDYGTSYSCDALRVITTDKDGFYRIPDVSQTARSSDGFLEREGFQHVGRSWRMSVYKEGYVSLGERPGLSDAVEQRVPYQLTPAFARPRVKMNNGRMEVDPIPLESTDLSESEQLIYDDALLRTVFCQEQENAGNPDLLALTRQMRDGLVDAPCHLPRSSRLSRNFMMAYSDILGISSVDRYGRRSTTPEAAMSKRLIKLTHQAGWENGIVSAGDLCDIVSEELEAGSSEASKKAKEDKYAM